MDQSVGRLADRRAGKRYAARLTTNFEIAPTSVRMII
jgi:hypothetical protein